MPTSERPSSLQDKPLATHLCSLRRQLLGDHPSCLSCQEMKSGVSQSLSISSLQSARELCLACVLSTLLPLSLFLSPCDPAVCFKFKKFKMGLDSPSTQLFFLPSMFTIASCCCWLRADLSHQKQKQTKKNTTF